jgi:RNA 2',3'-cyclic 3'-phosphodiesterase
MTPNWFLGVPVDTGRWLEPLARSAPSSVRVFQADDVHMTVAFLGPVSDDAARRAWAAVRAVGTHAVEASLGKLAAMGNPRRPSALSVVVEQGHDELCALIAALRGPAWQAAGARPDGRPPLPHITIARPSRAATDRERRAAVEWALAQPPVNQQVRLTELVLFTWAVDRRERQFRAVEKRTL